MNVIDQALDLINDRLGFGAPTELIALIRLQLHRMYALGALDQRKRLEKVEDPRLQKAEGRLRELQERNADLIRERNTLLRLLRYSDPK